MAEVNLFRETICGIFQFIRVSRTFERNLLKGNLLITLSIYVGRPKVRQLFVLRRTLWMKGRQRSHQFSLQNMQKPPGSKPYIHQYGLLPGGPSKRLHSYKNALAIVVNKKHTTIPVTVGTRKEAIVHFTLWVSFFIVRQVVEQGQCIRENNMVLTAVIQVQPWLTNRSLSTDRSLISSRLPSAI